MGCDASVAYTVVLESLVYYCGYFLCCSVASLVGSAGQVVSSFVVPLTAVFVVVVDEAGASFVDGLEGFFYRFHVVHVVLKGRFAYFWAVMKFSTCEL